MPAMSTNVPVMIGLRYVRAKRRNQFISFVSGFSLVGMAVGVLALIVVMSVLNGFDRQIKDSILKVVPHGTLSASSPLADWRSWADAVREHPRVEGVAPYVSGYSILAAGGSEGVEIQGILPSEEVAVSVIHESMRYGELGTLQAGEYNIILGRVLAAVLQVTVGDTVQLTSTQVSNSLIGPRPLQRSFTVSGVFETGGVIDQGLALIHIDDAKKMFRVRGGVQGLRIKVDDIYQAGPILSDIAANLKNRKFDDGVPTDQVTIKDWSQTQGSLFKAVKQEKLLVGILQMTIVAIAALNIITGLILMVTDKRTDVAVLRTLGLTARQVMAIFVVQGTSVGFIGLFIGATIGCITAFYFTPIFSFFEDLFGVRMFDPAVYYTSRLPSELQFMDVVVITGSAFCLSLFATLNPAYRASKIAPAEALRYE